MKNTFDTGRIWVWFELDRTFQISLDNFVHTGIFYEFIHLPETKLRLLLFLFLFCDFFSKQLCHLLNWVFFNFLNLLFSKTIAIQCTLQLSKLADLIFLNAHNFQSSQTSDFLSDFFHFSFKRTAWTQTRIYFSGTIFPPNWLAKRTAKDSKSKETFFRSSIHYINQKYIQTFSPLAEALSTVVVSGDNLDVLSCRRDDDVVWYYFPKPALLSANETRKNNNLKCDIGLISIQLRRNYPSPLRQVPIRERIGRWVGKLVVGWVWRGVIQFFFSAKPRNLSQTDDLYVGTFNF